MIRVRALCKRFEAAVALEDVTFDVEPGEVVGLLGPNGAGKTTCLRILTGFMPPDAGEVWIDGLCARGASRAARSRIGYLPEGAPAYPELRVEEFLRYRASLRGTPSSTRRAQIDRVVQACGLAEVRRRVVGQLSRGFRQRLGLANALLGDPPVLVLDEPTVGLDPNQVREVRDLVRTLGESRTLLLSTHVLTEVEAVCSRALILHRGRLVAQGPVEQLRASLARGTTLVAVRGPAARVRGLLEGIAGVARVDVQEEGEVVTCRLEGDLGPVDRERVAAAVLEAGLALQEIRGDRASLEQVFAHLTTDERGGGS